MRLGIGLGLFKQGAVSVGVRLFSAYKSRVIADGGTVEADNCGISALNNGLFQQASLLLIPSGYKSGKAYAEIPTNGNGDLTWTRGGTANRTNASGNIELMGANVPRLSYMYGSCPAVLLEPQRTNLLTYSNTLTDSSWSKIGLGAGTAPVVTANAGTSPDGTTNASRVQFNCGGATSSDRSVLQKPFNVVTNGANYAGAIYVKAYSSGEIGKQLRFVLEGITGQTIITLTDSWQRVTLSGTSATTSSNYIIETRGGATTNTTADILFYGAQLEAGAYPTTYIPTTSAQATRIADSFSRNNIYTNGLITSSGGTWFVELRNNIVYTRDNTQGIFVGDTSSPNTGNQFIIRGTTGGRLTIIKYVAGASTTLYTTPTDTIKIAIKWNGSTADLFVNGTKQVSATAFTETIMENLIGSNGVPVFIQAMGLFTTPQTDQFCQDITTL